jgi:hypothetical protein
MNNNLFTQMIYRIVFTVLCVCGCLTSFGFFSVSGTENVTFSNDFWYYYTNISNYVVLGVGIAVCASTVKRVKNGERFGYNTCCRTLKFCATVMIMVTCFVYIGLLGDITSAKFWNSIGNLLRHVIVPIMFIVDWLIFDEHNTISILDPLKAFIMPLIYVAYILIYGAIFSSVTGEQFEYPYFFLNVNKLGYGGVFLWVLVLVLAFGIIGYIMFLYDKIVRDDNGKMRLDFKKVKIF